ncbi:unnamed protein product, partial [Symbiodinium sp. KB8]
VSPDLVGFNAALSACERRSRWPLAVCLAGEKASTDAVTCNVLLSAAVRISWQRALATVARIEVEGIQPDSVTYNTAAHALCKADQAPSFNEIEVWRHPAWQGVIRRAGGRGAAEASLVPGSTVASACARAAVPGVAHRLLRTLQFSGVRLGTSAYNAFLASSRFHWSLAMATFEEMGEKALSRDTITLGAAVAALSADSTAWAKAMYFQRHRLNAPATTACSTACSNAGEWGRALAVLSKLAQSGLQEDQKTRTAAVAAGGCQGWRASLEKLGQADSQLAACNAALAACAETVQWHLALALLGCGPGARMTLDAISANAAVAACRSVWQNALYLLSGQVQLDASSSELAAVAAEASQQGTAVAMLLHDLEGRVEELLRR